MGHLADTMRAYGLRGRGAALRAERLTLDQLGIERSEAEPVRCGHGLPYREVVSVHPLVLEQRRVRCRLPGGHGGPHQGTVGGRPRVWAS